MDKKLFYLSDLYNAWERQKQYDWWEEGNAYNGAGKAYDPEENDYEED